MRLKFLGFTDLYDAKTCVESRYLLCQFTLEPGSNPAIQPGSNPVVLMSLSTLLPAQMPRLRFAGRLASIDIDEIARLIDCPCFDIFIGF